MPTDAVRHKSDCCRSDLDGSRLVSGLELSIVPNDDFEKGTGGGEELTLLSDKITMATLTERGQGAEVTMAFKDQDIIPAMSVGQGKESLQ